MSQVVARLHRSLLDALQQTREDPLEEPVTVAEIYKDLVPYARARDAIGVELNADYEHALLRLLAGEEGRARLEPESARAEIERELRSPNPNVTIYRKFAACEVWVGELPDGERDPWEYRGGGPAEHAATGPDAAGSNAAAADAEEIETAVRRLHERADVAPAGPAVPVGLPSTPAAAACYQCAADLPRGREVRFCPHCGTDQTRRECAECGDELEADWRFCIGCGAPARPA